MDKLDLVMLMSVNPGFGGQSFIAATLPKLAAVRQRLDAHAAALAATSGWRWTAASRPTTSRRLPPPAPTLLSPDQRCSAAPTGPPRLPRCARAPIAPLRRRPERRRAAVLRALIWDVDGSLARPRSQATASPSTRRSPSKACPGIGTQRATATCLPSAAARRGCCTPGAKSIRQPPRRPRRPSSSCGCMGARRRSIWRGWPPAQWRCAQACRGCCGRPRARPAAGHCHHHHSRQRAGFAGHHARPVQPVLVRRHRGR